MEEEGSNKEVDAKNEDPDGIDCVMEEFIVHLATAVKEAQQDEKCCYHCSSTEHFIHKCPLVKAARSATHLNQKEGTVLEKGAQTPQGKVTQLKASRRGCPKHRKSHTDSLLESQSLLLWYGDENVAKM